MLPSRPESTDGCCAERGVYALGSPSEGEPSKQKILRDLPPKLSTSFRALQEDRTISKVFSYKPSDGWLAQVFPTSTFDLRLSLRSLSQAFHSFHIHTLSFVPISMLSFVTFITYTCAALGAAVPVLSASSTATSTEVLGFNPRELGARSSTNIRAPLPQTNAERLRRGLPLLKPRVVSSTLVIFEAAPSPDTEFSSSRFVPERNIRARSSPAPCVSHEGVIKVTYTQLDGSLIEGYVYKGFDSFGQYGVRNEYASALHVKFCVSSTTNEVFDIITLNGDMPLYPFLGVSTGYANIGIKEDLGPGSFNYLYLVGSSHSTVPSNVGNTFTAVTGVPEKSKSTIWQFDRITNQLTVVWENSDHSFPNITAGFANDDKAIFFAGDLDALNRHFGSMDGRVTLTFESSYPQGLRDNWEHKETDFEEQLFTLLGVPWSFNYDTNRLYQLAITSNVSCDEAKSNPGAMYANYTQAVIANMQKFVDEHGDNGKAELNTLASKREINLVPDEEEKYSSGGSCEVIDGKLVLFFHTSNLGYWVSDCSRDIENAVNLASKQVSAISFSARRSIQTSWDPKVTQLSEKFQKMLQTSVTSDSVATGTSLLQTPEFKLDPNFAANYVEVNKLGSRGPSDWEKTFGKESLNYFEHLYEVMEQDGYGKDDMMQEAFTEAVEMNKITLRVTEALVHKSYNELHIEEGVLYIQTTPDNWGLWVRDIGSSQKLESLL
ncbi:hypothetical protein NLI96_g4921 [Meripilus lineatus]|uniref:Uncharacterized protein n=1 Tax=Meripilus lineatus TaxID=2056292 RepID=A0AAD5V3X4_9APHY|nr:hypothetical protein NLI96_g4921 [Physisporinus lineatus]